MDILARLANLPGALPGACAQGLIWGIMAIGVYLTYRILDVADLTVDGSFGTGGAVCVMMPAHRHAPVWAGAAVVALHRRSGRPALSPDLLHTFLRHPGHSGRYSHPAGPLLRQPADHGLWHRRR